MRARRWIVLLILGSCGGEPVLPPPDKPVEVASPKEAPAPSTSNQQVVPGKVLPWVAGGALEKVELIPNEISLAEQLKAQFSVAEKRALKPYVMVYSDECKPCVSLRQSLSTPRMKEAFQGVYLILLDHAKWGAYMDEVGMKSGSFPRIHELTDNGRASPRLITGEAWGEDIPNVMAPPLQTFLRQ